MGIDTDKAKKWPKIPLNGFSLPGAPYGMALVS